MIRAILFAQWRSMRSFQLRARPAVAIFSSITGIVFYGFWCGIAFGAQAFFANPKNAKYFPAVLSAGLLVMMLYWQVTPVITASMGASLDLRKLLAYPIPHSRLFFIEVLLRLTTCFEMLLVLAGASIGILRNPEMGGALALPRVALAAAYFCAFNVLMAAGLRSLLERLLKYRRVRELMMLVIVGISVLPQFLIRGKFVSGFDIRSAGPESPFFPWSAASHLMLGSGYAIPIACAIVFTAAAFAFSRWMFEKNIRFDGAEEKGPGELATGKRRFSERLFGLPSLFLPDPMAAIVEKELRTLVRASPFRIVFVMGCGFGLILGLSQTFSRGGGHRNSFMSDNLVAFATAYGVLLVGQASYFNCFGLERSAAQMWFSAPVPIGRTLIAKNIAILMLICVQIVCVALGAFALRLPLTPLKLAESATVGLLTAIYLIAFGNISSVRAPRPINPDKMNQSGSAKAVNALMLLFLPLMLLPIGLAYWARSVFESELVFFALLGLAAAFGALLYWVGMGSAVEAANRRREEILAALTQGEGPVSVS